MRELWIALAVLAVAAVMLFCTRSNGKPDPEDTHTGILKGTAYDCETADRPNLPCDGTKP